MRTMETLNLTITNLTRENNNLKLKHMVLLIIMMIIMIHQWIYHSYI